MGEVEQKLIIDVLKKSHDIVRNVSYGRLLVNCFHFNW